MNAFLIAPGSLKVMAMPSICGAQEEKTVSVMPAYIINKTDHTHGPNLSFINNVLMIQYFHGSDCQDLCNIIIAHCNKFS